MGEIRILLVDADSQKGFPNLALMKLSQYHKGDGHEVHLIKGLPLSPPIELYDKCYISVIYHQNRDRALEYGLMLPNCEIGGSGWDLKSYLLPEIEDMMPDYSLYDVDFSMGFTSRGCIRNCPWCVVPRKEGWIQNHHRITQFWNTDHKKIILLDNNFLASPNSITNLRFIIENDLSVNFNQGLDIRTVTEENAPLLAEIKVKDWRFKKRKYTFAFDHPSHLDAVGAGIDLLREYGIKLTENNSMFYVLVGFNTTPEQDLFRIRTLKDWGVGAFVMRYNKKVGPNRILLHMSRWVNRKYYQHVEFADYKYSDSEESYNKQFGGLPDESHGGQGCPQFSYAWANRSLDDETDEIIEIQEELER